MPLAPTNSDRSRRRSPFAAFLVALSLIAGCAFGPPARTAKDDGVRRVLLMPANLTRRAPLGLEGRLQHLNEIHVAYLEAHGLEVERVSLADAEAAWHSAANRAESDDVAITTRFLAPVLARAHGFDLLIVPDVVIHRRLRVTHRPVRWDGVKRSVRVVDPSGEVRSAKSLRAGSSVSPSPTGPLSVDSEVDVTLMAPVLSLQLQAFDRAGGPIFERSGGLDIGYEVYWTEEPHGRRFDTRMRQDLFEDPAILEESLRLAYAPYLPPLERPLR